MEGTLFWIFAICIGLVYSFNIDLEVPVVHAGPDNSMFGFAVSLHQHGSQNWLLIGAPRAETGVTDVEKGGAVYKCGASAAGLCDQIGFDTSPSHVGMVDGEYKQFEEKSNRWFGATVKSSGRNGDVVACAPRHVYFYLGDGTDHVFPMGTCFTSGSDFRRSSIKEYSPCKTLAPQGTRWDLLGNCLAGMSADIVKGFSLLIGSPGSYSWQGQIYVKDLIFDRNYNTFEGNSDREYDNYAGYSVAIGEYYHGIYKEYVAGVPRGNDLRGLVKIYFLRQDQSLILHQKLEGEQLGSYFGSSVCAVDVNGDDRDDVIVGAPYYTDRQSSIEKWEAGKIYVYYQNENYKFSEPDTITGTESTARFGSAVASIGDVNQDGYNDIAVGAPFHGDDDEGAVYIYHGSKNGLRTQASQVITPSDIDINLQTFGSSLAGALDMDGNQYPDILVGAYGVDQAVLLRSRPVVSIEEGITLTPEYIDLEKKCSDGTPAACFDLNVCFKHTGVNVPTTLDIEFTCTLDTFKQIHKRAYFAATGSTKHTAVIKLETPDTDWCSGNRKVYLREDFSDKYSPIGVDIKYKLVESQFSSTDVKPILNNYIPETITKQMQILRNCGDDGICIPDLQLKAELDKHELFIGGGEEVKLKINVSNHDEDSFETEVSIQIPAGFDFVRVKKTDNSEYNVACFDNPDYEDTVTCSAGNPLKASDQVMFDFTMSSVRFSDSDITHINDIDTLVEFNLNSTSTNPEKAHTLFNNAVEVKLPIKVNSTIVFIGLAIPEQVTYDPKPTEPELIVTREEEIGPEVTHVYEVRNMGPSSIDGADINIKWPAFTSTGEHLLYLLDVKMKGGSQCTVQGDLNPEKLEMRYSPSVRVMPGTRRKREEDGEKLPLNQDCKAEGCVEIHCPIDFILARGEAAFVEVRSRLWKETLIKGGHDNSQITSRANVQVTSMPYRIPSLSYPGASLEITSVASTMKPKALPVPIWVIILAILGGLLILLCIILVLWKAGFFKRKRVEEQYMEKETVDTGDVPDVYVPPATTVVVKDEYKENVENEDRDSVLTDPEYENVVKPTNVGEPLELEGKPKTPEDYEEIPEPVKTGPLDDTEYVNIVEIDPDLMIETPEPEPSKAESTSDLISTEETKEEEK
ncbi:integrin alpha-8-like [Glandiceps talaboti]